MNQVWELLALQCEPATDFFLLIHFKAVSLSVTQAIAPKHLAKYGISYEVQKPNKHMLLSDINLFFIL